MMRRLVSPCLVAAAALINVAASAEVLYHLEPMGFINPRYGGSSIRAINEWGQGCGEAATPALHAFFWDRTAGMIDLGDFPGGSDFSSAQAVNNLGHVAGYGRSERGAEAFVWTPEIGLTALGDLPGGQFGAGAYGINDLDQVVGVSASANATYEAFLWDPESGMIGLGDLPGGQFYSKAYDINNAGQVVGISISNRSLQAFIWDAENGMRAIRPAPDGSLPYTARGVNELGQVTGTAAVPPLGRSEAFFWDPEAGLTILRFSKNSRSWSNGLGVNDLGQVVGLGGDQPLDTEGFIWDAQGGVRGLDDLLDAVSTQRYGFIGSACSINNRGQIGVKIVGQAALLTPFVLGDMNWDGQVNALDIEGFLLALFDPPAYDERFGGPFKGVFAGDMNQDATVDALDIEPFIEVLFP